MELYLGNRITVRVSGTHRQVLSTYYPNECRMERVLGARKETEDNALSPCLY